MKTENVVIGLTVVAIGVGIWLWVSSEEKPVKRITDDSENRENLSRQSNANTRIMERLAVDTVDGIRTPGGRIITTLARAQAPSRDTFHATTDASRSGASDPGTFSRGAA